MENEQLYDPKKLVAQSYDQIAQRYAEWAARTRTEERERYMEILTQNLDEGAEVLDLGCGAGGFVIARLARRFRMTAVDISTRSMVLARQNVPAASFICADMTEVDFPASRFDAVAAFFSIIHVPRQEHAQLLSAVCRWLRPGGVFVGTMGANSTEVGYEKDWFGSSMYWSHFDSETNRRLVERAGLEIQSARNETGEEDGVPSTFAWIVARKPDTEAGVALGVPVR